MRSTIPCLLLFCHIDVPVKALQHRFVAETENRLRLAEAADDERERVVGTGRDNSAPQLYGWAANIAAHSDNTGYIYGVCLNEGVTKLHASRGDGVQPVTIMLRQGDVFRLNDFVPHWTEDSQPRIAVMAGPFAEPCDELALQQLQEGLQALASGAYYGAPRMASGHVTLGADECWATRDFETSSIMLLEDARREGLEVITCAECEEPAVVVDHYWPWHGEASRCGRH